MKKLTAIITAILILTATAIPMTAASSEAAKASEPETKTEAPAAATSDVEYVMFGMLAGVSLAGAIFVIKKSGR